jgi:ribosomal protein S18 acetylase RimI-like enzyme
MQTIRIATIDDARILSELGARTFYDTFRPYNSEADMQTYITKSYSEAQIESNLQDQQIHYALLFDDNEAVGYVKLLLNASNEKLKESCIELEKIYVLQTNHGNGAGKLLMDYAITFAKDHQYRILFLGVWEENKRAVRFYEKNGFVVFATRRFALGSAICDDFMMKLDFEKR